MPATENLALDRVRHIEWGLEPRSKTLSTGSKKHLKRRAGLRLHQIETLPVTFRTSSFSQLSQYNVIVSWRVQCAYITPLLSLRSSWLDSP
jgi:hypothetical protein